MALNIGLIGAAPSSDKLAPFHHPDWEIWACSPSNWQAPRVDAYFEMHNLDRKYVPGNEPWIKALQGAPRVYVAKEDKRLPHARVYPKKEVFEFFGNYQFLESFFQSQVSYMLAFAIMQQPQQIGLWGIDMAAETEYTTQRPGCHYFFIEAEKRGIPIVAPPQSDILEPLPLYAYKEFDPAYWRQKARKAELKKAIEEKTALIEGAQQEIWLKQGALSDIRYSDNTWRARVGSKCPKCGGHFDG